jgi:hypothetical protein
MSEPVVATPVDASSRGGASADWEQPPFLKEFPADPELDALVQAFLDGNYALIRVAAPELAKRSSSSEVRRAALELRRRISPDRMLLLLLSMALLLFGFLVSWSYLHGAS